MKTLQLLSRHGRRVTAHIAPLGLSFRAAAPVAMSIGVAKFSTGHPLYSKKKDKGKDKDSSAAKGESPGDSATATLKDFSVLQLSIKRTLDQLSHNLSQLRAGGQLAPETVAALPVVLERETKQKARIQDVAEVILRGRFYQVMVHDAGDVKSVKSAILASPHSLVPDPAPATTDSTGGDAERVITVRLPPVSQESRQRVLGQANAAGVTANGAIKEARQKHHKLIRSSVVDKKARPDDAQIANKMMEDIVKNGSAEVKRLVEACTKALQK